MSDDRDSKQAEQRRPRAESVANRLAMLGESQTSPEAGLPTSAEASRSRFERQSPSKTTARSRSRRQTRFRAPFNAQTTCLTTADLGAQKKLWQQTHCARSSYVCHLMSICVVLVISKENDQQQRTPEGDNGLIPIRSVKKAAFAGVSFSSFLQL